MSFGITSLNHLAITLAAESSVENSKSGRAMAKAMAEQAEADDQTKNSMRESAEGIRQVGSVTAIASSAVSVGRASAQAGSQVSEYSQFNSSQGAGSPHTESDLSSAQLGNGRTVGERFNSNQVGMLANPERVNDAIVLKQDGTVDEKASIANIQERSRGPNGEPGFTEGEARDLVRSAGADRTFNHDKAVEFMWQHRKTEPEMKQEQQQEKIRDGIQNQLASGIERNAGLTSSQYSKDSKKFGEAAQADLGFQSEILDDMSDFNKRVGEIELKALNGSKQQTSSTSK